jgi:hypothetical protein
MGSLVQKYNPLSGKFDWVNAADDSSTINVVVYEGSTTDDTLTELFVDGVSLARTLIPTDTQTVFSLFITGKQTGGIAGAVGDSVTYKVEGEIKNIGGTVTINNNTTITISQYPNTENWIVQVLADDVNDSVNVSVQGEVGKNISWVGELRIINL